jgi:hypothetical protein
MLVDQQWLWKENRALARRLRALGNHPKAANDNHLKTGQRAD